MKLTADIGGSKTRINAYHRDGNVEKFCLFGEYGRAEDSENPLEELVERLKKLPLFSEKTKLRLFILLLGYFPALR